MFFCTLGTTNLHTYTLSDIQLYTLTTHTSILFIVFYVLWGPPICALIHTYLLTIFQFRTQHTLTTHTPILFYVFFVPWALSKCTLYTSWYTSHALVHPPPGAHTWCSFSLCSMWTANPHTFIVYTHLYTNQPTCHTRGTAARYNHWYTHVVPGDYQSIHSHSSWYTYTLIH